MFGIDMGVSGDQYAQHGALESSAGFATNLGEEDLTASNKFMQDILSGDASKVTSVLSPQISAAKTSAQQNTKTMAENGTRGGGTGAATAKANDTAHSDITNVIAELTKGAASSLSSTGSGLLSAGMAGNQVGYDQASAIQKQKLAKFNDIVNSTAAVAAAPFTGGASLTGLTSNGGSGMGGGFSMPGGGGGGGSAWTPQASDFIQNMGEGGGNAGLMFDL
jgi:hypothetical protein